MEITGGQRTVKSHFLWGEPRMPFCKGKGRKGVSSGGHSKGARGRADHCLRAKCTGGGTEARGSPLFAPLMVHCFHRGSPVFTDVTQPPRPVTRPPIPLAGAEGERPAGGEREAHGGVPGRPGGGGRPGRPATQAMCPMCVSERLLLWGRGSASIVLLSSCKNLALAPR